MFCEFHKQRIATEKCTGCGKQICEGCKNILKGKYFCPSCASVPIPGVTLVPQRAPYTAAVLSFLIPGLGQVYNGQLGRGLIIFLFCWLIIPWLYGVVDAYGTAIKINRRLIVTSPSGKDVIAFLLVVVFLGIGIIQGLRFYGSEEFWGGLVEKDLSTLSQAAEKYKQEHGRYPVNFSQLYFADPPYLDDLLCESERHGYRYTCRFSEQGYTFVALPLETNTENKNQTFTVTTGGIFSPRSM